MTDSNSEIKSNEAKHSAKAILEEACDTIRITYWVQSKEYAFADWEEVEGLPKYKEVNLDLDFYPSDDDQDDDVVLVKSDDGQRKAAITGVCSLGALALATYTLYDVPLSEYSEMQSRDPYTGMANLLLNDAITKHDPSFLTGYGYEGEIVAAWNDAAGRTRDEVLDVFEAAIAHPMAEANELWSVGYSPYTGYTVKIPRAMTKQEAEELAELLNSESKRYENYEGHEDDFVWANETVGQFADTFGAQTYEPLMVFCIPAFV